MITYRLNICTYVRSYMSANQGTVVEFPSKGQVGWLCMYFTEGRMVYNENVGSILKYAHTYVYGVADLWLIMSAMLM